ncbi:MAG: methionine--tRNA ligase [Nitrospirota bacterium]|nr:methionine--tRNA ligase [Nitrospirota bacterium]
MAETFYITTPIYYVNDVPHIGHAYTTIAADVLTRYRRLKGDETFFLTGLDEHGQKVQQAAAKAGISPQEHCDRLTPQFQNLWKKLDISNDGFIRTTDDAHKAVVQRFLQKLYDQQLIYRAKYTGWYCTFDERFWTKKDVEGGLCPDCQRPLEQLSENNYFFRMSQYQQPLIDHITSNPNFIRPDSRRNEVLGFLQKPLEDLSISRPKSRLSWGIELPFDQDYVTYVWFDALVNYISGLEYLAETPSLKHFWPASLHLVGKDILTTHAVYWSTMLMALKLPMPQTIFAHGWWTMDGEKMSKSRQNVIDPYSTIDTLGTDAFRYFLLREVPFGQDGDFSHKSFIDRINSDLANGIGNLLSRTITLIQRNCGGKIPEPTASETTNLETELQKTAQELIQEKLPYHLGLDRIEFNRTLESIWRLVQLGNQYIDKTTPWVLAKDNEKKARLHTVLYHAIETLRFLCVAISAFMPKTAEEMSRQLGLHLDFSTPILSSPLTWGDMKPGTEVVKGKSLFPRIDPTAISKQGVTVSTETPQNSPLKDEVVATASKGPPSGENPLTQTQTDDQISIEAFQKVQLKVAKILEAERVSKSNKLLKLQVDLGTEQRQIIAGIGKKYAPDDVIGKTIVVVVNLKPAKLMGIESQGMVLAAGGKDVFGLVTFEEEGIEPGTQVK